jgi:hypothetical protein
MTFPRNDEIQSALVAYLKTKTAITNLLVTIDVPVGSVEIREDQWQGTEFDYPNIRVRMVSNVPLGNNYECAESTFTVSIMAFSQDYSSWEADKIAGIISTSLNGKSFITGSIQFYLRTTNLIPAVRSDIHTWRAECLMQGTAAKI